MSKRDDDCCNMMAFPDERKIEIPKTRNDLDEGVERKRVLLIGSSGGGTATLGHNNTSDFVTLIAHHLNGIGGDLLQVTLDTVLFVSLDSGAGFDSVTGQENATLLYIQDRGSKQATYHDTLDKINEMIKKFEKSVAIDIGGGSIHGLISVSCKPSLFSHILQAAAKRNIPVTGTGGSSLSVGTTEFRIRLIGNSGGSVSTTPETKAISFASALSNDWKLEYNPWKSKMTKPTPPSWKSVLNSCLPGFWSVALFKRLILTTSVGEWLPEDDRQRLIFIIESYTLPTLCAVIMATSRRKVESVQMAAVLAASTCYKSILGGLVSGWLVAYLEERLLYFSILHWKIPATFTNLITGGLVGVSTAAIMSPVSPLLQAATEEFRSFSIAYIWNTDGHNTNEYIAMFVSSVLGLLFCFGSKIGWCKF